MKFKTLTWIEPNDYTIINEDTTPNLLYRIGPVWDDVREVRLYRLEYTFGYVPESWGRNYTGVIGVYDTKDEAKTAAQEHYERLITESYLESA